MLGLDKDDGTLEATFSFPYPGAGGAGEDVSGEDYSLELMKALREVNVDNNAVGWYQSTYLGSYFTKDTILHQFEFQEQLPNSVVLIYDSVRTAQGGLSLKALRLTDGFMDSYRRKRISAEALAALSPSAVFEELPVKIRNPALIQALLVDIAEGVKPSGVRGVGASAAPALPVDADVDISRLDLSSGPYLEKHLEFLTDVTDALLKASYDSAGYQRRLDVQKRQREEWIARRVRVGWEGVGGFVALCVPPQPLTLPTFPPFQRAENELRRANGEPVLPEEDLTLPFFRTLQDSRSGRDPLDSVLMAAQVANYCGQVNKFAGSAFGKLFLAQAVRPPGSA